MQSPVQVILPSQPSDQLLPRTADRRRGKSHSLSLSQPSTSTSTSTYPTRPLPLSTLPTTPTSPQNVNSSLDEERRRRRQLRHATKSDSIQSNRIHYPFPSSLFPKTSNSPIPPKWYYTRKKTRLSFAPPSLPALLGPYPGTFPPRLLVFLAKCHKSSFLFFSSWPPPENARLQIYDCDCGLHLPKDSQPLHSHSTPSARTRKKRERRFFPNRKSRAEIQIKHPNSGSRPEKKRKEEEREKKRQREGEGVTGDMKCGVSTSSTKLTHEISKIHPKPLVPTFPTFPNPSPTSSV